MKYKVREIVPSDKKSQQQKETANKSVEQSVAYLSMRLVENEIYIYIYMDISGNRCD